MQDIDTEPGPRTRPFAVLLVAHALPPHVGGIEVVVEEQARALSGLGLDVTVLTSSWGQPGAEPDGWTRITVPALNLLEKRFGVPFPIFSPSLVWRAIRAIRRADVVHLHDVFYLSSLVAGVVARVLGTPMVLTQHVDRIPHPSRLVRTAQEVVFRTYGTWLMRHSARVFVLNSRVADFVADRGVPVERIEFLPNGVDLDAFRPCAGEDTSAHRQELGLPAGRVLVLFVGRLVPKKGFELLVDVASPDFDLVFVGGDERKVEVAANGGQLHFLGQISRAKIGEVYCACDIFCLPSTGEGFPVTVQEAMASGMPVVTTRDDAYGRYELSADVICLIEPLSAEVGAALHRLAADGAEREKVGTNGRSYAVTHFSWQRHVERLRQVYSEAAEQTRSGRGH